MTRYETICGTCNEEHLLSQAYNHNFVARTPHPSPRCPKVCSICKCWDRSPDGESCGCEPSESTSQIIDWAEIPPVDATPQEMIENLWVAPLGSDCRRKHPELEHAIVAELR